MELIGDFVRRNLNRRQHSTETPDPALKFQPQDLICLHLSDWVRCAPIPQPMKINRIIRLLLCLFSAAVVLAADEEAKKKEKGADKEAPAGPEKEPVLSVTDHEITLSGKVVKYRATTG